MIIVLTPEQSNFPSIKIPPKLALVSKGELSMSEN
jgi:hypothetical protein